MATTTLNTPWVESPFFDQEIDQADYDFKTKELIRRYAEDGYVVFDPQIDEVAIDAVVKGLKPRFAADNTNRIQDAWEYNDAVKQIAAAPRVLEVLKLLYRREPIPFQTLNFSTGSQQRTHSDSIHFNSIPERFMCGVWVALEDVHDGNGPLHYYPKSHKLPFYDLSILGLKGSTSKSVEEMLTKYYSRYEDFIAQLVENKKMDKKVLNIKKGQALIWSANLLHGGEPITQAGSTRFTQVNHYYFEGCAYYRPMLTDMAIERISIQKVVNIATGKEVKSQYLDKDIDHIGYSYKLYLPAGLMRSLVPSGVRQWVKRLRG